ncbi:MAG: tRNA lysidine(34) synthetase TilS [Bacteroidales bacterium]|nr:tRNA lysidine(34) synthetase TilS [Bacteroidales bacterium]
MMKKRFAEVIMDMRGLINEWSAPVLLAVSGGIDSMCMADLFNSLEEDIPFAVAHCNFRLRGEESDGDEAMVRSWAEENGIVFHHTSFDTQTYASEKGISIEMAARELRYRWFEELCVRHGYRAVCVAHNANDNAETLMLNLLRGSGLKGLSGMSPVSVLPCGTVSGTDIILLRPLLQFTRKQIEGYVFARKVPYREDSTNASSDYKRNRIRNEVFPIFEKINPSFVRTLNREMGYFAEAEEIVDDWATGVIPHITTSPERPSCHPERQRRISLPALMSQPHWRYLLYRILEPYGFNSATLGALEDLLSSSRTLSGKRFESEGYLLQTGRDELVIMPRLSPTDPIATGSILPVRTAGTHHFAGHMLKIEVLDRDPDMPLKQPAGVLVMDASRMRFPFVIRRWRHGDWFIPIGMKGKKKISDLFADLKYDGFMKDDALMIVDVQTSGLADSGHIAGVVGVRIDDRYKITETTEKIIRITVDHEEDI